MYPRDATRHCSLIILYMFQHLVADDIIELFVFER